LELNIDKLQEYLSSVYDAPVTILDFLPLGKKEEDTEKVLKAFGYGIPYIIEFGIGEKSEKVVLETMRFGEFGHEHFSDRAKILLWQHSSFNRLPRHVRSIDVGAFTTNNGLKSLGDCDEFFVVTQFVDGWLYHNDLDRIGQTGKLKKSDEKRCLALSDYLVGIHKTKHKEPGLYVKRVRELIGNGECIMGLLDSYPSAIGLFDKSDFIDIEHECVVWRWRLKDWTDRLCQVHGDFHPWNVLFHEDTDFTVLDRSRGEWGEAADDVAAMTINFIFYSLRKYGRLAGVFERLFRKFWENYLKRTMDTKILDVIQPFYAWRGLVVASPIWYPNLRKNVRIKLLNFVRNVLQVDRFDLESVNSYIT
jgi:hypothetical protein